MGSFQSFPSNGTPGHNRFSAFLPCPLDFDSARHPRVCNQEIDRGLLLCCVSSHPSSKCSYNGLQCRIAERDHSPSVYDVARWRWRCQKSNGPQGFFCRLWGGEFLPGTQRHLIREWSGQAGRSMSHKVTVNEWDIPKSLGRLKLMFQFKLQYKYCIS